MGRLVGIALVSLCALAGAEAHASVWDRDTVQMERQAFPEVADLITGKFVRHSDALYEWRVEDREAWLAEAPDDLEAMDDLAVALDKLERRAEAIAVMQDALLVDPDRYETHANLGTFLVHAGELEEGLVHIERALEIDPDAHFGRERYQLWLVQYAMQAGEELPLAPRLEEVFPAANRGFTQWVLAHDDADDPMAVLAAIEGITGMMRFEDHRSPMLLEALGDLMLARKPGGFSLELASQAYLAASESTDDPKAAKRYRELAEYTLGYQPGVDLPMVEYDLHWERADGSARASQIQRDELVWIADPAVDPEAAFHAKYLVQPKAETAVASAGLGEPTPVDWSWLYWIPAAGAVLVVVLGRSHALS